MPCFALADFGINITEEAVFQVVERTTQDVQWSKYLHEHYVRMRKSGDDFCVGTEETQEGYTAVSSTNTAGNTTILTTDADLCNIGLPECLNIGGIHALVEEDEGKLKFHKKTQ
jgi:hypothetical protein